MTDVKLNDDTARRLANEVGSEGRDIGEFVNRAVLRELARERFEIEEVRKAIAEADRGEFATDEEVAAVFGKHASDEAD